MDLPLIFNSEEKKVRNHGVGFVQLTIVISVNEWNSEYKEISRHFSGIH